MTPSSPRWLPSAPLPRAPARLAHQSEETPCRRPAASRPLAPAAPATALLLRLEVALPQIAERHEFRLHRAEAEALGGVREVHAVVLLDELFDAGPRLPWQAREPAGEEHVVFGLEALDLRLELAHLMIEGVPFRWHGGQGSSENQTSGSHSSRAYGIGRSSISTSVLLSAATSSNRLRSRSASPG